MTKGLLSIGMFSRASLLSIKALRAYHEAGILVPARVDPATGYRSYLATQLTDAAVLRRLRALDLPLADVGEILRARDPEVTRKILAGHGDLLREELARISQAVEQVHVSLDHPGAQTPVHVRDEPAIVTLEHRGKVRHEAIAEFLDVAYPALYEMLQRLGIPPGGPAGAVYPPAVEEVEEVVAYVPIAASLQLPDDRGRVAVGEVPAATVAVLTHHGGYDSIGDTYQLLGRWVAEHATSADMQVREVYITSPTEVDDPAGYRTDICWPVAGGVAGDLHGDN